jgi:hypothetical protein
MSISILPYFPPPSKKCILVTLVLFENPSQPPFRKGRRLYFPLCQRGMEGDFTAFSKS